ncbi:major histocompatibility complex class I-related gene protein-like [Petaurus breviceps papuanus]|uniref:major histocompatibility complex class I-related gene protein-like n=1 Tax=Petaurus breviceps papuanus TaxID=3040969 RepID=UPI0036DF9289
MENQRRKGPLTSWLLMLCVFALRGGQIEGLRTNKTQAHTYVGKSLGKQPTLQTHHRHECQFTAVGKTSLLDYTVLHVIDDVDVGSYDKQNKQFVVKEPWMSQTLGEHFMNHKKKVMSESEMYFQLALKLLSKNDTKINNNHTIQILAICELDGDIEVTNQIHVATDGEDFFQVDDQVGQWAFKKPVAQQLKYLAESNFWADMRKNSMKEHCVNMMRKLLQDSSIKGKVPPEVTVSHHSPLNGSVTLSCLATGFYPRSILLHWEKNGQLGVWGKERSSGILPNADATFYLQVTLELPLMDTETNYTCVVEHSALEMPVIYSVPEKSLPTETYWFKGLGILAAFILVLSCAVAFTIWKKTGKRTHKHAAVDGDRTQYRGLSLLLSYLSACGRFFLIPDVPANEDKKA